MDSSRILNLLVCLYVTAAEAQTDFQLSGEETPKNPSRTSASERPDGKEKFSRRISFKGKRWAHWFHSGAFDRSRWRAMASLKFRWRFNQKWAGR